MVATRGGDRSIAYDGASFYYQTPELIEAVDTMGAGDSYITAFLMSMIKDGDIQAAMREGSRLAAKSCMVEGSFGFGASY
ncbi:Fructosamine kinase FrlD [compost metagenome]